MVSGSQTGFWRSVLQVGDCLAESLSLGSETPESPGEDLLPLCVEPKVDDPRVSGGWSPLNETGLLGPGHKLRDAALGELEPVGECGDRRLLAQIRRALDLQEQLVPPGRDPAVARHNLRPVLEPPERDAELGDARRLLGGR